MKYINILKNYLGDDYVFRAGTISGLAEKNAYTTAKKYFEENIKKILKKRYIINIRHL